MTQFLLASLYCLAFGFSGPANAFPTMKDDEHLRLSNEMKDLASQEHWNGVEAMYQQLAGLNVPLNDSDYLLGAQAAQGLGDVDSLHARLQAAATHQHSEEIIDWLTRIHKNYGRADLITPRPRKDSLTALGASMGVHDRLIIEQAAAQLRTEGSFSGFLPCGLYSFAGKVFRIEPQRIFQVHVSFNGLKRTIAIKRWDNAEAPIAHGNEDPPYVRVSVPVRDEDGREPW